MKNELKTNFDFKGFESISETSGNLLVVGSHYHYL